MSEENEWTERERKIHAAIEAVRARLEAMSPAERARALRQAQKAARRVLEAPAVRKGFR